MTLSYTVIHCCHTLLSCAAICCHALSYIAIHCHALMYRHTLPYSVDTPLTHCCHALSDGKAPSKKKEKTGSGTKMVPGTYCPSSASGIKRCQAVFRHIHNVVSIMKLYTGWERDVFCHIRILPLCAGDARAIRLRPWMTMSTPHPAPLPDVFVWHRLLHSACKASSRSSGSRRRVGGKRWRHSHVRKKKLIILLFY